MNSNLITSVSKDGFSCLLVDYDAGFKMSGGFFVAAGSAGMAMSKFRAGNANWAATITPTSIPTIPQTTDMIANFFTISSSYCCAVSVRHPTNR